MSDERPGAVRAPDSEGDAPPAKHPVIEKLHERRERHMERSKLVRVLIALVGATLTLGGLALLVLPGPAFLVIPIGLALLALEFAWAESMLEKAVEQADKAKRKAAETTRTQRILSGVATALGIAAAVVAVILWDIPFLPV